MKNMKFWRTALVATLVLTVMLSVTGGTIAWFTDSVSSGVNTISAGNLDMVVSYKPYGAENTEWTEVKADTKIFNDKALYEPGYTEAVWLKIENAGSLAFRYDADVVVTGENLGVNKEGVNFSLADYLNVKSTVVTDVEGWENFYTTRDSFTQFDFENMSLSDHEVALVTNKVAFSKNDAAMADYSTGYILVVLEMPTTVGNEANHNGKDVPSINFGLNVVATQVPHEKDAFGSDYDADAQYPEVELETDTFIYDADDLMAFAAEANAGDNFAGKKVSLMADVDLAGEVWTPISSFAGEFDGNNYTISNFEIDATQVNGGFFNNIAAGEGERVHDLTLSDVTATVGNNRFGTLANSVQGIVNRVNVKDVTVTTTDSAAWVGGMCAFMSWPWMNDCTVENVTVHAENGADLIGGFACILQKNSNMIFDNNDVHGFTVTVKDTTNDGCGVAGFAVQTQRGWEFPKIINSDVTGINITAEGNVDTAGFIAWPGAHTTVENCTTQGVIDASGVSNSDCFAGGFFGNLGWNADLGQMGHVLTNCSADVDIISGGAPAGGFVGSATNSNNNSMYATFNNCKATGDVTNVNGVAGGFAGDADRGDYNACSASGVVTGSVTGGFIGQIDDVTPKYDHRYPAGTRDYLVDKIFIDDCTGSSGVALVGMNNAGADVTIDGVVQQ